MPENRCDICGGFELLPFKCKYCGGTYCGAHRLPENHQCAGLKVLKQRARQEVRPAAKRKAGIKLPGIRLAYSGHYAYIIIGITVLVFIAQFLFPSLTGIFTLSMGTLLTRPWGLVTSIFLHGGITHLFFNMLALFFFGPLLERRIGSGRFLALYFGSGILAGLAQVIVFPASAVLGASGAIFGVLGALTVLSPNMIIYLYFVPLKMVYATILFAALDLFPMITGTPDGIAHIAHLAGLAIGLTAGFWYRERNKIKNAGWQV